MSENRTDCIAIDGPAASGKSTIGRVLASRFGYSFLDTGLMYRAFTLAALRRKVPPTDEACARFAKALSLTLGDEPEAHIYIDGEDVTALLHDREIERNVSSYARLDPVRAQMRKQQRDYAARGHTVLAGRDIGQVVVPDAALKFYLEADEAARARRRNTERGIVHEDHARESHKELSRRDQLDSPQTYIAPDAIVIDTSELTLDEVVARVLEQVACANA
ncbi:MAG: (d)CMP kinase [bacterium]